VAMGWFFSTSSGSPMCGALKSAAVLRAGMRRLNRHPVAAEMRREAAAVVLAVVGGAAGDGTWAGSDLSLFGLSGPRPLSGFSVMAQGGHGASRGPRPGGKLGGGCRLAMRMLLEDRAGGVVVVGCPLRVCEWSARCCCGAPWMQARDGGALWAARG
jgi:hypothetical protein